MQIIKNTKLVNHDQTITNANIYISNDEIIKIETLEGEGDSITIPGFIDTHIHGSGGFDVSDSKEAILQVRKKIAKLGVTSFFPTLITDKPQKILDALKRIAVASATTDGAKICGIHAEGPFISPIKKGAHELKYLQKANLNFLKKMITNSQNKLSKITYAPEIGDDVFLKCMLEQKIIVSVGHTNCTYDQAQQAFNSGAQCMTHFWNAMSGLENRNPGAVTAGLLNSKIFLELIADLIHVDHTTIKLTLKSASANRLMLVSDALAAAGTPDGESVSGGLKIVKKGLKITLKDKNVIAGSACTIYDGFKILVTKLNVSLEDAVKMTSYNACIAHQLSKKVLKVGKKADLIIMNQNLKIKQVLINGKSQI